MRWWILWTVVWVFIGLGYNIQSKDRVISISAVPGKYVPVIYVVWKQRDERTAQR